MVPGWVSQANSTDLPGATVVIDKALQARESAGNPIRVGIVGAGATGRAVALKLGTPVPGIRLAAIANRCPEHGERAFREAGILGWTRVSSVREAEAVVSRGLPALTDDPSILTACDAIDVIEVIGTVGPSRSRGSRCI